MVVSDSSEWVSRGPVTVSDSSEWVIRCPVDVSDSSEWVSRGPVDVSDSFEWVSGGLVSSGCVTQRPVGCVNDFVGWLWISEQKPSEVNRAQRLSRRVKQL